LSEKGKVQDRSAGKKTKEIKNKIRIRENGKQLNTGHLIAKKPTEN
jgi:hypothetical protein